MIGYHMFSKSIIRATVNLYAISPHSSMSHLWLGLTATPTVNFGARCVYNKNMHISYCGAIEQLSHSAISHIFVKRLIIRIQIRTLLKYMHGEFYSPGLCSYIYIKTSLIHLTYLKKFI